ncbi:hypothetical protein HDV05_000927 [Chytridiales sp. JEL 0842]|nr:hypothetical protein HDV05_000927 [Chytridiales sp. JEL 0842]
MNSSPSCSGSASSSIYTTTSASNLYAPANPSKLSLDIQFLYSKSNWKAICDLFHVQRDSKMRLQSTTLCCVPVTRKLIDGVASFLLDESVSDHGDRATAGDDDLNVGLSIGSGSGLFEWVLNERLKEAGRKALRIVGVDVSPINVFLPDAQFVCKPDESIWSPDNNNNNKPDQQQTALPKVQALLAVYIRRPQLLKQYLQAHPLVSSVIVVGPKSEDPLLDDDVKACVESWGRRVEIWEGGTEEWERVLMGWDRVQCFRRHSG